MKTTQELIAEYRSLQTRWQNGTQTPEIANRMAELWWEIVRVRGVELNG